MCFLLNTFYVWAATVSRPKLNWHLSTPKQQTMISSSHKYVKMQLSIKNASDADSWIISSSQSIMADLLLPYLYRALPPNSADKKVVSGEPISVKIGKEPSGGLTPQEFYLVSTCNRM